MFWATVTGLSEEPSRAATLAALRAARGITVLDLDYRPMFWDSREEARRWVQEALPYVDVAVGNLDEWDTAIGTRDPRVAASTPLDLAVVKQGPKGVLARRGEEWAEVPPVPVEVVNGLGAGDAFGARCAMRFSAIGRWSARCASATPPARSSRRGWPAPTRCRPRTRSRGCSRMLDLTEIRARRPEAIAEAASARVRPAWPERLMVIAADHPGRGMLEAGGRR